MTGAAVASPMLSDDVAATNRAYSEGEVNASVASLSRLVDTAVVLELLCNFRGSDGLMKPLKLSAIVSDGWCAVGDV